MNLTEAAIDEASIGKFGIGREGNRSSGDIRLRERRKEREECALIIFVATLTANAMSATKSRVGSNCSLAF